MIVETAHLSGSSETDYGPAAMRLVVARCEVVYTGRLTARLPEAVRLLMFKADGSFLVHDDVGGFRPLNWIRKEFRANQEGLAISAVRRRLERRCLPCAGWSLGSEVGYEAVAR